MQTCMLEAFGIKKTVDRPGRIDIDLRQLTVSGVDPTWAMIVLGST
jgi:hypothetical protein